MPSSSPDSWQHWLTFTVIGSGLTALVTLIGFVLKDYLFARHNEVHKLRVVAVARVKTYTDQIALASEELSSRLSQLLELRGLDESLCSKDVPTDVLLQPTHNDRSDPGYIQYKTLTTAYRLAALLAWIELYRRDMALVSHASGAAGARHRALRQLFDDFGKWLADGHKNEAQDWSTWTDSLIFRDEQRSIGRLLVVQEDGTTTVADYRRFFKLLQDPASRPWLDRVLAFVCSASELEPKNFVAERARALEGICTQIAENCDSRARP